MIFHRGNNRYGYHKVSGANPLTSEGTMKGVCEDYRIYGDTIQSNLPVGYTELEYIESTGTQYIDTGVVPNNTTKMYSRVYSENLTNSWYISGARRSTSTILFAQSGSANGDTIMGIVNGAIITAETGGVDWNRNTDGASTYNFTLEAKNGVFDYTITNETLNKTFTATNVAYNLLGNITETICIGAFNEYYINYNINRWYEYMLWNNGVLVRNMIPSKRNSDNAIGMYDIVNNIFYTNSGIGEFIAGEEVKPTPITPIPVYSLGERTLPEEYTQVEYIESTGTQYIDTEFIANQDTSVEVQYEITANNLDDKTLFACGERYNSNSFGIGQYAGGCFVYNRTLITRQGGNLLNTKYIAKLNKNILYIDGVQKGSATYANFTAPNTITLFAANYSTINPNVSGFLYGKIYYTKIWDNGVLVRNMIPCYRKADNVVGMYDTVNGGFYTNEGTGTFIAGDIVSAIEVKSRGKNLFDLTAFNNATVSGDGRIMGLQLKPNTQYTCSSNVPQAEQTTLYFGGLSTGSNGVWLNNRKTITSDNNGIITIYDFRGRPYTEDILNGVYYIMVTEGSIATPYQPYQEPQITNIDLTGHEPLRKIDDIADYVDYKNSRIVRNIGKIDLGTMTYRRVNYGPIYLFYSKVTNFDWKYTTSNSGTPILCDEYSSWTGNYANTPNYFAFIGNGSFQKNCIGLRNDDYSDVTDFKNSLSNVYIYYQLATPIYEPITLPQIPTVQGTCIIDAHDEYLSASRNDIEIWSNKT